MHRNPPVDDIRSLLCKVNTIAVVGFSPEPARPSHRIAAAMQGCGYTIIPIRPGLQHALGEPAWPDLRSVPGPIDLVNVFRAPEHVMPIIDECIDLGLPAVWLQDGVVNEQAAARASAAGIVLIMNDCVWRAYRTLGVATARSAQ